MAEKALAATQIGQRQIEVREFALPEIAEDAALLKVEVAGVCGADVHFFQEAPAQPRILGHENVGVIARIGRYASRRWGLKEGDLVALEEYLPCYYCEWCHKGEYRHCWATDILNNPGAPRYGLTDTTYPPSLWGGYSQYLYMPHNAVWHRLPRGTAAEEAVLAVPLSNGVQWACIDGGVGVGKTILIQGPGQMGLGCVVAAKQAGADCVIVTGLSKDRWRLDVARQLGADYMIEAGAEDVREKVAEITGGKGVDVVVDCTSGARSEPTLMALDALRTRGGVMVLQGQEMPEFPNFPLGKLANKYVTLKMARGHSYAAVERALEIIGAHRYPLHLMRTHHFDLSHVDTAIRATGGEEIEGAVHVSVRPWAS